MATFALNRRIGGNACLWRSFVRTAINV